MADHSGPISKSGGHYNSKPRFAAHHAFVSFRGALKRELVACLRTGRALREPRARSQNKPQGHGTADVWRSAATPPTPSRRI